MLERQIRWNRSKTDELFDNSIHQIEYYLLIVNAPREVKNIEMKIFTQLQPILSQSVPLEMSIPKSNGLIYKYIQFMSLSGDFNPKTAYGGKVIRDRNLYPRKKDGVLEDYITRILDM